MKRSDILEFKGILFALGWIMAYDAGMRVPSLVMGILFFCYMLGACVAAYHEKKEG